MTKDFPGEKWKKVNFDFKFTNKYVLEVSNHGRLRSTNKFFDGALLAGSFVNGYKIIRLKFFKERDAATQKSFDNMQKSAATLTRKIKKLTEAKAKKSEIKEVQDQLKNLKTKMSEKFAADAKLRVIYFQKLVHRIVAENFLPKPAASKTVVAHMDFIKENNKATNLKWMSPEENYKHQQKSPNVIEEKKLRRENRQRPSTTTKLNTSKVQQLKKMLNQGKPIKQLVAKFGITDTQILRIKRGENWGNVEAAK